MDVSLTEDVIASDLYLKPHRPKIINKRKVYMLLSYARMRG